jgi:hypothetical protein
MLAETGSSPTGKPVPDFHTVCLRAEGQQSMHSLYRGLKQAFKFRLWKSFMLVNLNAAVIFTSDIHKRRWFSAARIF